MCRATKFGEKLPKAKAMQDMLQRLDVMAGEKITEGLDNQGKKLTYYMYEIEKNKQLIFSVKRMCVRRPNSKSTKINALRSLYHEMFPERLEEIGSRSYSEKVLVGHVDTAQASNEQIVVYAEAEPAAPEVTDDVVHVDEDTPAHDEEDTESEHTQGEDAVPQMTHEEADLVAIDLIEVDESDIDPIIADVVPGAAHVCGAPVPDALAAAEMAPMLDHARQRKERKKAAPKSKGKGKKNTPARTGGTKKTKAPAKTAAETAASARRFRLKGEQHAPPEQAVTAPAATSAPPAKIRIVDQSVARAQTSFNIVRSIQRELEIFQIKHGKTSIIQVTTLSAPSRPQAIQWTGILKEVLEREPRFPKPRRSTNG